LRIKTSSRKANIEGTEKKLKKVSIWGHTSLDGLRQRRPAPLARVREQSKSHVCYVNSGSVHSSGELFVKQAKAVKKEPSEAQ
jgi:hypothetical protein